MSKNLFEAQAFTTVEELRAYHDEQFIRLAYRLILCREADPDGLNYHLIHLRRSMTPEAMVAKLRHSEEANIDFSDAKRNGGKENNRSKLKILLCNERFLFRFGVDRVMLMLGEGLNRRGHTIYAMANRVDPKPLQSFAKKIVEVPQGEDGKYLYLNEFTAEWLKQELPKIFSNEEWPDVVVIGGWPFFASIPLFRDNGIKTIFLDCGSVPLDGMEGGQLITQEKLRSMRRHFLPECDQIIAISKFIEDSQSKQDSGNKSNTISIKLGADHMERDLWSVNSIKNSCLNLARIKEARELGYKIIINLGRWEIGNYKNSLALFDLVKIVREDLPNVVTLVLSDGSDMGIPNELTEYIIPIGYPSDQELREIMLHPNIT